MTPLETMDRLLGSSLSERLAEMSGVEAIVESCLKENGGRFLSWCERNSLRQPSDIDAYWSARIQEIERGLSQYHRFGDLSEMGALDRAVSFLAKTSGIREQSLFLSESAAEKLLQDHPPVHLLSSTNSGTLRELLSIYPPLAALSLTRHTESRHWQDDYLALLSMLPHDKFELRPISSLVVDRAALLKALAAGGKKPKPWSMSHAKETGMIVAFTADTRYPLRTPNLLLSALYFHYAEETLRAAHALIHTRATGERIAAIIRSTRRKLPFFNPNHHSEALYWESGLGVFSRVFPELSMEPWIPYLSCGAYMHDTETPVSLNLIDRLWDENFSGQHYEYFRDATRFTYHFREALWTEILRNLRKLSRDQMASEIFTALDLDDVALTEALIERIRS